MCDICEIPVVVSILHLVAGNTGLEDPTGGQRAGFQHFWRSAAPRPSDSKPGFDSRRNGYPKGFRSMFFLSLLQFSMYFVFFCIECASLVLGNKLTADATWSFWRLHSTKEIQLPACQALPPKVWDAEQQPCAVPGFGRKSCRFLITF